MAVHYRGMFPAHTIKLMQRYLNLLYLKCPAFIFIAAAGKLLLFSQGEFYALNFFLDNTFVLYKKLK